MRLRYFHHKEKRKQETQPRDSGSIEDKQVEKQAVSYLLIFFMFPYAALPSSPLHPSTELSAQPQRSSLPSAGTL